ncbi:MAG: DNA topoisomerase I [Desulfamplus sp.]|nr:DNA topoisomerase I [Desulfamplus sp.]
MNKIILEEMDPAFVRTQFDEILVREVTSLIEIDSDIAMLTYNLSTISTIIVAVEREREIRAASTMPPARFTFESLVDELVDLGLYKDDDMLKSVRAVLDQGYLTQDVSNSELKAEASAYTIVGFLDKMFPGMQGIQLVAFVMQMIDEVLSERKTLGYAMESFDRTLKNSGVSVSREKAEKKAQELALDNSQSRQMKEVALKLKEASIKRLAQQRLKEKLELNRAAGRPSFHFDGGSRLDKVKITSVFEKGPSEEEIEAEKRAREAAEREYQEAILKAAEIAEQERRLKEAEVAAAKEIERKAAELAAKEQALKEAEMAALRFEQQQAELRAKEAEMAAREAELRLREEQLKAAAIKEAQAKAEAAKEALEKLAETQHQHIPDSAIEPQDNQAIDDIESRIAAFESELSIQCPLCKTGTIKQEKTKTGKDYFICSDKNCRFVSWSQPYHFSCPLCKNPFLVDFQNPDGTKGLKCPRASCSFSQNHLYDPAVATMPPPQQQPQPTSQGYAPFVAQPTQYAASPPPPNPTAEPPKKRRLVRRVKR